MSKVKFIKNARVTNNSIVLKNCIFPVFSTIAITESNAVKRYKRAGYLAFKYIFPSFPLASRNKNYVLITTEWTPNLYHFFFETIRKLIIAQKELNNFELILPKHYLQKDLIMNILELFGINKNQIITINKKSNLKIRNLYYLTNSELDPAFLKQDMNFIRKKILDYFPDKYKNFGDKIYISREKAEVRKVENEEELVTLLKSNGYRKVFMEDYSFLEQLSIIRNAKNIIALHGQGIANILFAKDNAKLYELVAPNYNKCYENYFSEECDFIQYQNILCKSNQSDAHSANITVDLKKLEKIL